MLIVGNWKAYVETATKAKALMASAKRLAGGKAKHRIVIAPPTPFIGLLAGKSKVGLAVQDLAVSAGGATTGELSMPMLTGLGVQYAIIGHSERRAAGETNSDVAQKVALAIKHKLVPILCVGEVERDLDATYLARVREEITSALSPLSTKDRAGVVIAYEPIWAIGKSASEAITPSDLAEMALYIRKILDDLLPGVTSASATILYGGSVDPRNSKELAKTGIDGFLVGRASTDVSTFSALVKAIS